MIRDDLGCPCPARNGEAAENGPEMGLHLPACRQSESSHLEAPPGRFRDFFPRQRRLTGWWPGRTREPGLPPPKCTIWAALAVAGALLGSTSLAEPPRVLTPQDVFALQRAEDVQIRPDGRSAAYVRASADIMTDSTRHSVWGVDLTTGEQNALVPGSARSPRWSPDGQRLAYLAADANGRTQLFVCRPGSGVGGQITDGTEAPGEPVWSPDGRSLAFGRFVPEEGPSLGASPLQKPAGASWAATPRVITAVRYQTDGGGYTHPGHTHLFVASAEGGVARQITGGPYDESGAFSWTPDGRALLFSSNREENRERTLNHSQVFRVDVADGELAPLTRGPGDHLEPTSSPDGRLIAYAGCDYSEHFDDLKLYVMNSDGSGPRQLGASLDRSLQQPHWTADGRGVYATCEDAAVTKLVRLGLDGTTTFLADGIDDDRPGFTVSAAGTLAFALGAPDHPSDVAVVSPPGEVRRLTRLNADLFAGKTLAAVRTLTVRSSYDGRGIGAWVVLPPGYDPARRYPTILVIHGGPYGTYGPYWSTTCQLYAAAGYAVVYSNPRGSISYGTEFAQQIDHDFPSHDYDDLMSAVDATVAAGIADPARLFVTGGSAGGQLAAWIVGKTDRFQAAAALKPVINVASNILATDQYLATSEEFGKMPWEDPLTFWRHSPLSLVGNVKTPTLIMVGEEDRRTAVTESLQLYAALQLRAVPTALVLVPGAGHESFAARPSQLAAEETMVLDWFKRYDGASSSLGTR